VLGELIILFKFDLSLLDLLPLPSHGSSVISLLHLSLTLTLLLYLSLCVYYGLFNLKFLSFYELHPGQQTDPFSMLYSANLLTKLAAPLCFNFLKLIHLEGTAFHAMLGVGSSYHQVPLIGEEF
jgi:hypothetical protein